MATVSSRALALPNTLYSPVIPQKLLKTVASSPSTSSYPGLTFSNGTWNYTVADLWTSGFFPAELYLMNERSALCSDASVSGNGTDWLTAARARNAGLTGEVQTNTVGHDVGFLSFPFQAEYNINPNDGTRGTILGFTDDLAARYNSIVGCTRSWDTSDPADFEVVIDNMMNIELLLYTSKVTSNSTLLDMAVSHATKTMENHVRADGSTYHVVNYDAQTGAVKSKFTAQGYADNSTWTRGQSWGMYGFGLMYNYTSNTTFLETSRTLSQYYLSRLSSSSNGVPPWDFDAPEPAPADTSSATIASTALLLLSSIEEGLGNSTGANYWAEAAAKILTDTSNFAWNESWDSLLSNGTSFIPMSPPSFDTGIIYGDYYFVKAGNLLLSMGLANCTNPTTSSSSSPSNSASAPSKTGSARRTKGGKGIVLVGLMLGLFISGCAL